MRNETHYLCRVPWANTIVVYGEQDYKYQRTHEERLLVPDPKNNVVLLAQGTRKDMLMLRECFRGELTNVS